MLGWLDDVTHTTLDNTNFSSVIWTRGWCSVIPGIQTPTIDVAADRIERAINA